MIIELSQGKSAVVDDADADLAEFKWSAWRSNDKKTFYAIRHVRKPCGLRTTQFLHRVVAERAGISGQPDHWDRDGLNNRRNNLRQASHGQNMANRRMSRRNSSGFKGVYPSKNGRTWVATIRVDKKTKHLGTFERARDAAVVYDQAALEHFGEFAATNEMLGTL